MNQIDDILNRAPVIPVLEIAREQDAEPLARALYDGGLPVLEITLRTEAALPAIRALSALPGIVVGAGTVLNPSQLEHARNAGAAFVVSPGLTETLVETARALHMPILPGVATAGEIMRGLDLGLDRFKFFPAETAGGARAVAAFSGPFRDVRFCPTGGVDAERAKRYLELANVICVGGSWVAPRDAVLSGDWTRITALAAEAAQLSRVI